MSSDPKRVNTPVARGGDVRKLNGSPNRRDMDLVKRKVFRSLCKWILQDDHSCSHPRLFGQ